MKKVAIPISSIVVMFLLVLAVVSLVTVRVNGVPAADQQCSTVGTTYLDGIGTHEPAGQTFKPSQTSVVAISIHIRSLNSQPTPMAANILLGGVGGAVAGSFSFSVPAAFGSPNGDWLGVQFPSGVSVNPGSTYALDLVDQSSSSGIRWDACSTLYTEGCGYANGFCATSASWAFVEYAGDFSIALSPSVATVVQGSFTTITVSVTSLSNFDSPVTLTLSGAGVSGTFDSNVVTPPPSGTTTARLTVFVPGSVAVGVYPLTVTGTSGSRSNAATLTLNVLSTSAADFAVQASPSTVIVAPGATSTTSILVTSFDGFNSQVSLSASWFGTAPTGVTFNVPSSVTPAASSTATSTGTITADPSASTGIFTLRVTGTSGSASHFTDVTTIVASTSTTTTTRSPDFSIAASQTSVSMQQGLSGSTTIIVTSVAGFTSPVTLTASWVGNAPSGVSFALPSPITPPVGGSGSSPMAVTSTSTASSGSFTLRVAGTSGSISHTVDIIIQINALGPKCIIATATYGSELAPEVQLLRNFRDHAIIKTQAGSNFMVAFNAWYYSFSPSVASYISNHWVERDVMKVALYPLIGMLAVSYGTFTALDSSPEFAALLAGLVASSLIGGFYLGLPLCLLKARFKRLNGSKALSLQRLLEAVLVGGISSLIIGELLSSAGTLVISSSLVVLSTLFLSAQATSSKIAPRLHSTLARKSKFCVINALKR